MSPIFQSLINYMEAQDNGNQMCAHVIAYYDYLLVRINARKGIR